MKRWGWIGLTVVALVAAGCSSGKAKAVATTTTAGQRDITVHVVAEATDTCVQSPIHLRESVVVTDQHGTTIGTAPFALSPGAQSCDFTATVTVPTSATYYAFATDTGVKMGTMSKADLSDKGWTASFDVGISGNVNAG